MLQACLAREPTTIRTFPGPTLTRKGTRIQLPGVAAGAQPAQTFLGGTHPSTSWVGIALAAFTAVTMPLLSIAKRRVGVRLGSSATVSEGGQSMICAYLSVALLVGLLANAIAGWWWADPVAALAIAAIALKEGRESWRGEGCCDAC